MTQPMSRSLNVILVIPLSTRGISSWGWIHTKVNFKVLPTSAHGPQTTSGVMSYVLLKLPLPGGPNWHGPNWHSKVVAWRSELARSELAIQTGCPCRGSFSFNLMHAPKFLIIRKSSKGFSSTPFREGIMCLVSKEWLYLKIELSCSSSSQRSLLSTRACLFQW